MRICIKKRGGNITIKMAKTVRPDMPFLTKSGTILRCGEKYDATANRNGAISGVCENGEKLGVRPGEFEFITITEWVFDIWSVEYPLAVQNAVIEQGAERGI